MRSLRCITIPERGRCTIPHPLQMLKATGSVDGVMTLDGDTPAKGAEGTGGAGLEATQEGSSWCGARCPAS